MESATFKKLPLTTQLNQLREFLHKQKYYRNEISGSVPLHAENFSQYQIQGKMIFSVLQMSTIFPVFD